MMKEFVQINDEKYACRKSRCSDCGYTQGTAANLSGLTALKAKLSAELPLPFLCHFNMVDNEVPEGKEVLCQGWIEACNQLDAEGHYQNQTDFQRRVANEFVDIICEIERRINSKEIQSEDEAIAYYLGQLARFRADTQIGMEII